MFTSTCPNIISTYSSLHLFSLLSLPPLTCTSLHHHMFLSFSPLSPSYPRSPALSHGLLLLRIKFKGISSSLQASFMLYKYVYPTLIGFFFFTQYSLYIMSPSHSLSLFRPFHSCLPSSFRSSLYAKLLNAPVRTLLKPITRP